MSLEESSVDRRSSVDGRRSPPTIDDRLTTRFDGRRSTVVGPAPHRRLTTDDQLSTGRGQRLRSPGPPHIT